VHQVEGERHIGLVPGRTVPGEVLAVLQRLVAARQQIVELRFAGVEPRVSHRAARVSVGRHQMVAHATPRRVRSDLRTIGEAAVERHASAILPRGRPSIGRSGRAERDRSPIIMRHSTDRCGARRTPAHSRHRRRPGRARHGDPRIAHGRRPAHLRDRSHVAADDNDHLWVILTYTHVLNQGGRGVRSPLDQLVPGPRRTG